MALSFMESFARRIAVKFLEQNLSKGCLIFKEKEGEVLTFKGSMEKCPLTVVLKVHKPGPFYWKIFTDSDLGFAEAYIQGDFSFEDEDGGTNIIALFILNKNRNTSVSLHHEYRGWSWAAGKYMLKHLLRQNTVRQARRNISRHYDLSNDLFRLYLDEKMQYSCGIFKKEDEGLRVAQQRKMDSLIAKLRIKKEHNVLDIGCGWGYFAVEAVKRTGCNYTGVTLSEEQVKFAEELVKKEGLQDKIKFLLCDYRQVPKTCKYDRIISVEMVEHVGNEYMEEFFRCCESMLAEDGLFVLQFISIMEEIFPTFLRTAEFVREYIFPGGCIVSLTRMLEAMAKGSRLSVEHVENIGPDNYARTLRYWRRNLLRNKSKILALGFDEKFLRLWEYYFHYCAGGFKSGMLKDYQVVFSRQGNVAALGDPYQGFPSAFSH